MRPTPEPKRRSPLSVVRQGAGRGFASSLPLPRSPRAPRLIAALVGLAGLISLASAAFVPFHGRMRLLTGVVPFALQAGATSAVALGGLGLMVVAGGLARRQRLAWWIALALLVVAGASHVLKDLDIPEAGMTLGIAVLLIANRREFDASPGPGSIRRALGVVPGIALAAWGFGVLALIVHANDLDPRPTFASAAWGTIKGMAGFGTGFKMAAGNWVEGVLPLLGVVVAVVAFAAFFRPVVEGLKRSPADPDRAFDLVRRYGEDSLSYFALRQDKSYFFWNDGMVAYRYLWNLGLVSGDPVAAPEERAAVAEAFIRHARGLGWGVAVLAGSAQMASAYRSLGLRPYYLGDEAVVDPRTFSLEGRRIRKVRQSCHRLQRNGYELEFVGDAAVGPDLRDALDSVARSWRGRAPERGFTMSLGRLPSPLDLEAMTVIARDADGRAQGYLHLVPCWGDEPGFSLDQMRRRPDTPNGLTEWMIAETTLELGRRGVSRFSLNFAVRGRLFEEGVKLAPHQRLEAAILGWLNPFFQLERLRDFNAKFDPAWVPRFVYYEAPLSLPRVLLAYLETEALLRFPFTGIRRKLEITEGSVPG